MTYTCQYTGLLYFTETIAVEAGSMAEARETIIDRIIEQNILRARNGGEDLKWSRERAESRIISISLHTFPEITNNPPAVPVP